MWPQAGLSSSRFRLLESCVLLFSAVSVHPPILGPLSLDSVTGFLIYLSRHMTGSQDTLRGWKPAVPSLWSLH